MRKFILDLAGPLDQKTKKRSQDRRGQDPNLGGGQHPGLLLQRYLCENATGEAGNPEEKRAILQAAISAAGDPEVRKLYTSAFDRWKTSLPALTAANDLQTVGRLIVGLGSENVLETGITLHHTYGMPIIPGSALKGLAAHYCDQVWGTVDARFRKTTKQQDEEYQKYLNGQGPKPGDNYHRLLFGTTDDSGCIVFHDAWYVPESSPQPLTLDVMTPHHPQWLDGSAPPTDFDSPIPVPFLSVTGKFRLAVSWRGPQHPEAKHWTQAALSLLKQALADWGIGGKTSSGYGRLKDVKLSRQGTVGAASTVSTSARSPALPPKRASGTRTTVRIIGTRDKGFDVQEEGRPQGTLTVGNKPADLQVNVGDEVNVEVHYDDPKKPQYKWPSTTPNKRQTERGKRKR